MWNDVFLRATNNYTQGQQKKGGGGGGTVNSKTRCTVTELSGISEAH